MDSTLKIQAQIRQNAEELSSYIADLSKWENDIKFKEKSLKERRTVTKSAPVRLGAGTVTVQSSCMININYYFKYY